MARVRSEAQKEKDRARGALWRANNPDRKSYKPAYYQKVRDAKIAKVVAWKKDNPEKAKTYAATYRAKRLREDPEAFRQEQKDAKDKWKQKQKDKKDV